MGNFTKDLIKSANGDNGYVRHVLGFKGKVYMIIFNFQKMVWVLVSIILITDAIISTALTITLKLILELL